MKEAIKHFVVKKAKEIFELKGYKDTKMEEIAIASGISKPTLYKYLISKDNIFRAVLDFQNEEFDRLIAPIISNSKSFPEKLEAVISGTLRYLNQNRGTLKVIFYEFQMFCQLEDQEGLSGIKRFLEMKEKRLKIFEEFFGQGVKEGFIKEDIPVRFIVICFTGVISEFCLEFLLTNNEPENMDVDGMSELIVKVLTLGIFKQMNR